MRKKTFYRKTFMKVQLKFGMYQIHSNCKLQVFDKNVEGKEGYDILPQNDLVEDECTTKMCNVSNTLIIVSIKSSIKCGSELWKDMKLMIFHKIISGTDFCFRIHS